MAVSQSKSDMRLSLNFRKIPLYLQPYWVSLQQVSVWLWQLPAPWSLPSCTGHLEWWFRPKTEPTVSVKNVQWTAITYSERTALMTFYIATWRKKSTMFLHLSMENPKNCK